MSTKHTGGNWKVGRPGTVVTDTIPEWLMNNTGHDDIEYYGGYLIAESISTKTDANLMAAAPNMLEALKGAKAVLDAQGINEDHCIVGLQYKQIINAINQAEQS
ncbi:MAG: hypothetical protein A2X18_07540 [Bacteroidetes bacterium GWF2_40_14]|nr:MAG: hypothetical protein A2X18_07540 [Bacteroidetes bacterium GWF2_40_14]